MRDDFTKQTLDVLAKRVGVRCSNPSCRKLTTGPRVDSSRIVNTGVGAHITAASPGGPRYNGVFSPDQRQTSENGIWLCQSCAKLIDSDLTRYTVELLHDWKRSAEDSARSEVEGQPPVNVKSDRAAEIELTYRERVIRSPRHDYELIVTIGNLGSEPLGPYHVDVEVPRLIIERPEIHAKLVPERTTREVCFFRVKYDPRIEVYPGDSKAVLILPYFMDDRLYDQRADLFTKQVRATLYRSGFKPLVIEKRFRDLQCF